MAGVMAIVTIAPMTPWAPVYGQRGTPRRTPLTPNTTPPSIGPSSSAAGSPIAPHSRLMSSDSSSNTLHCSSGGHAASVRRSGLI